MMFTYSITNYLSDTTSLITNAHSHPHPRHVPPAPSCANLRPVALTLTWSPALRMCVRPFALTLTRPRALRMCVRPIALTLMYRPFVDYA